jgi:putative endonuclease
MHYVYIIYSETFDVFYKGESISPEERVIAHNAGRSEYTKGKGPWRLVYLELKETRTEALKRERQIKKLNKRSLLKLLQSDLNMLGKSPCHVSSHQ